MSSINNVVLVGRAGKDPDIRTFNDGKIKASVNMAVNRPTKEQQTDWFEIQLWGKQAETAKQYLKRGNLFGVTGSLRQESWESEGQKRSKVIVNAHDLRLMQSKSEGEQEQQSQPQQQRIQQPDQADLDAIFASEDEIPF